MGLAYVVSSELHGPYTYYEQGEMFAMFMLLALPSLVFFIIGCLFLIQKKPSKEVSQKTREKEKRADYNIYQARVAVLVSLYFFIGLFETTGEGGLQSSIAIIPLLILSTVLLYKGMYSIPKIDPLNFPSDKMRTVAKYCLVYIIIALLLAVRNLYNDFNF